MSVTGTLFFIVFALPLVLALIWIMRQDTRKKSYIGLFVLGILVVVAVAVALYVGANLNSN